MARDEVTILVGGAAGDGSGSANAVLLKSCSRAGLHVFATYNYQSAIRGGHIYWKSRIGSRKIPSQGDRVDVLVALNQDSVALHGLKVVPGGAVVYNCDWVEVPDGAVSPGVTRCPLPVGDLTQPFGRLPIMQNTVNLGALVWLLGLVPDPFAAAIHEEWKAKGQKIEDENAGVFWAGYENAKTKVQPLDLRLKGDGKRRLLVTGNEALGAGLIAGGCKFYSAYPMTPATGILHYLVKAGPRHGVLAKQAEDEIAVVNMAIGAAHMGVRSACATSGGGFALMSEAMGLAGMLEEPVVVIDVQRTGPSTGLPTKTEQGDLSLAMGASQGDYPRVIIAPLTVEDCCVQAQRALNLAEKYQNPVTMLSDLYLAEHFETTDTLDLDVPIDRGKLMTVAGEGEYLRYKVTDDGVSPRAVPGMEGCRFTAPSDEHDEDGHVISDILSGLPGSLVVRRKMLEKRRRKLDGIRMEMGLPVMEGPADADVTLVGWGSTYRLMVEAAALLAEGGVRAGVMAFRDIMPMRGLEVAELLKACRRPFLVENNFTGQFGRYLACETGIVIRERLLKADGEPFSPGEIADAVRTDAVRKETGR